MSIFRSGSCYYTVELRRGRPSRASVVDKIRFLRTRLADQRQIWRKCTFSPYLQIIFFVLFFFFKFCILDCLRLFFVSLNVGPYGRKQFKGHLSESTQQLCSQNSCILLHVGRDRNFRLRGKSFAHTDHLPC